MNLKSLVSVKTLQKFYTEITKLFATKDELGSGLSSKANKGHDHNDTYYTESEVDNKLSGKADYEHGHDEVYYTRPETDIMINEINEIPYNSLLAFDINELIVDGKIYPVVGEVDENNVVTLSSAMLKDGLYTLRYSNGSQYKEIGTIFIGEVAVESITATKATVVYEEGDTLNTDDVIVTAHYNDGTSSQVTGFEVDKSSVIMSAKGSYQLKISYMNCTTNITIIVSASSVPTGNLFNASTCTIGKRINSTGELRDQTNTFLTDYIEIGDCMASGTENIIHWQGFHMYKVTSADLAEAGVEIDNTGTYKGVAYFDATGKFLGQDSLYVTEKVFDSEGNYQLVLNATYTTATKIRVWGVTLPVATSVSELQNCKLTLNQLISEI